MTTTDIGQITTTEHVIRTVSEVDGTTRVIVEALTTDADDEPTTATADNSIQSRGDISRTLFGCVVINVVVAVVILC